MVFRDNIGFRISAAGWYDHAYSSDMNQDAEDGVTIGTWGNSISTLPGELDDAGELYA